MATSKFSKKFSSKSGSKSSHKPIKTENKENETMAEQTILETPTTEETIVEEITPMDQVLYRLTTGKEKFGMGIVDITKRLVSNGVNAVKNNEKVKAAVPVIKRGAVASFGFGAGLALGIGAAAVEAGKGLGHAGKTGLEYGKKVYFDSRCPKCGGIVVGMHFCPKCGTKIGS